MRAVGELAGEQHGAVSTAQLDACGLDSRARHRAVAAGVIVRLAIGVYKINGAPDAVEFLVPRECRGGGCGLRVHSTTTIAAHDRVRVDGLACTSATRTIIDLAQLGISDLRLVGAALGMRST